MKGIIKSIFALAAMSLSTAALAVNVGYYDMIAGQGNATQVPSILIAGETPVLLNDLTAADLAGIDVLYVQNPSNFGFGAEYVSRVPDVEAAVAAGMVLIIHDRRVTAAETILPGGAGFTIVRDFSDNTNIEIIDDTTLVTNGPGGVLDNNSLDGGNSSSHGFTVAGSLPGDSVNILSRTDAEEIVTMCYPFESGAVVYSTIPLDFYLGGAGVNPPKDNMTDIYAPNVVGYGAAGACAYTLEVAKTYRHTGVCFETDNDGDGQISEDAVDGVDNDGDGLVDEDASECPDGTDPGDEIDNDGEGLYFVDSVIKKNGSVDSYNPGQLYAVTSVNILADTDQIHIGEFYSDCTQGVDDLLDLNPRKGGGRAKVVVEHADGTLEQLFDANTDDPDVDFMSDETDTIVWWYGDFAAGDIVHLYVKFGPGDDSSGSGTCENVVGAASYFGDRWVDVYDDAVLAVTPRED